MASPSTAPDQSPAAPPKPFQFSLREMLIATFGLAAVFAIAAQFGFPGIVISFWCASFVGLCYGALRSRPWFLGGLAGLATLAWNLLFPPLGVPRPVSRRFQCSSNLRQIALALHHYHDVHGSFPPTYVPDAMGRPMHSWRVLILPYLERMDLYDRYDFHEPWNGPNNRKLALEMPRVFACPSQPKPKGGPLETNYVAVVGPHTAWPEAKPRNLSQFADGTSQTLLVVEVHDSGISWLEPRDLHMVQMPLTINPPRGQGVSSRHGSPQDKGRGNCAQAAFCDGHMEVLPSDLPPSTLRALLTADGGEDLGQDTYWTR